MFLFYSSNFRRTLKFYLIFSLVFEEAYNLHLIFKVSLPLRKYYKLFSLRQKWFCFPQILENHQGDFDINYIYMSFQQNES